MLRYFSDKYGLTPELLKNKKIARDVMSQYCAFNVKYHGGAIIHPSDFKEYDKDIFNCMLEAAMDEGHDLGPLIAYANTNLPHGGGFTEVLLKTYTDVQWDQILPEIKQSGAIWRSLRVVARPEELDQIFRKTYHPGLRLMIAEICGQRDDCFGIARRWSYNWADAGYVLEMIRSAVVAGKKKSPKLIDILLDWIKCNRNREVGYGGTPIGGEVVFRGPYYVKTPKVHLEHSGSLIDGLPRFNHFHIKKMIKIGDAEINRIFAKKLAEGMTPGPKGTRVVKLSVQEMQNIIACEENIVWLGDRKKFALSLPIAELVAVCLENCPGYTEEILEPVAAIKNDPDGVLSHKIFSHIVADGLTGKIGMLGLKESLHPCDYYRVGGVEESDYHYYDETPPSMTFIPIKQAFFLRQLEYLVNQGLPLERVEGCFKYLGCAILKGFVSNNPEVMKITYQHYEKALALCKSKKIDSRVSLVGVLGRKSLVNRFGVEDPEISLADSIVIATKIVNIDNPEAFEIINKLCPVNLSLKQFTEGLPDSRKESAPILPIGELVRLHLEGDDAYRDATLAVLGERSDELGPFAQRLLEKGGEETISFIVPIWPDLFPECQWNFRENLNRNLALGKRIGKDNPDSDALKFFKTLDKRIEKAIVLKREEGSRIPDYDYDEDAAEFLDQMLSSETSLLLPPFVLKRWKWIAMHSKSAFRRSIYESLVIRQVELARLAWGDYSSSSSQNHKSIPKQRELEFYFYLLFGTRRMAESLPRYWDDSIGYSRILIGMMPSVIQRRSKRYDCYTSVVMQYFFRQFMLYHCIEFDHYSPTFINYYGRTYLQAKDDTLNGATRLARTLLSAGFYLPTSKGVAFVRLSSSDDRIRLSLWNGEEIHPDAEFSNEKWKGMDGWIFGTGCVKIIMIEDEDSNILSDNERVLVVTSSGVKVVKNGSVLAEDDSSEWYSADGGFRIYRRKIDAWKAQEKLFNQK